MAKNLLFIFSFLFLSACVNQKESKNHITVFCASSLFPIIEQIKIEWEKNHDEKLIINAASSGTLSRQIENGASADIFLSANKEWMNHLIESMKLKMHPKPIASNRLCVVTYHDSELDSMDINGFFGSLDNREGMISIADPGHVPLGKYTKQALEYYQRYNGLSTKFILTKDARSALRLVELGEVDAGFVYLSDALTSTKIKIISLIPPEVHEPIVYQSILLDENDSNREFLDFITSLPSINLWEKYGFKNPVTF